MSLSDRQRITLFMKCKNLKDLDIMSKSDPQISISMKQNNDWKEIHRTEVIENNLNPEFLKNANIEFIFEEQQPIKFEVWDIDIKEKKNDLIGMIETTVGKIMGSDKLTMTAEIKLKNKKAGTIIIKAEKEVQCPGNLQVKIHGHKIKDLRYNPLTKSSPYMKIQKQNQFGEWNFVHKSEDVHHNLNPQFKQLDVKMSKLCDGDYQRPIKIEIWDFRKEKDHEYIGEVVFTMNQLIQTHQEKKELVLRSNVNREEVGKLTIEQLKISSDFLDYLQKGLNLSLIGAVDFTASNLEVSNPKSLHHISQNGSPNKYMIALQAVAEILLQYDTDKMVPMYGFGGIPHFQTLQMNEVSHCFPMNGSLENPFVQGIEGVIQSYIHSITQVKLHGPTLFNPLIKNGMITAKNNLLESIKSGSPLVYTTLLILTDGEIHDMTETINSLVEAANSDIPFSVIIIGIGEADFTNMYKLDGDQGLSNAKQVKAKRDICTFTEISKIQNNISHEVLQELPKQIEQFMEYYQQVKPQ